MFLFAPVPAPAPPQVSQEVDNTTKLRIKNWQLCFKAQSRNMVNRNASIIIQIMKQIMHKKHVN